MNAIKFFIRFALQFGVFLLLFIFSGFCFAYANLYINEFSSSSSDDWVEIYNSDPTDVDLSGYILRDSTDSDANKKELSGSIAGSGFTTVDWSNKLNNNGDSIRLFRISDSSIIDQVTYGDNEVSIPTDTQTVGRSPDGASSWVLLSSASKGSSNDSVSIIPTPTLTPTNSPTPTKVPTPTKEPTATKVPTPTRTPTPVKEHATATPTPVLLGRTSPTLSKKDPNIENTPSSSKRIESAMVLAAETENKQKQPTEKPQYLSSNSEISFSMYYYFALGVILLLASGILLILKYKPGLLKGIIRE